jgi:hypothetical protein
MHDTYPIYLFIYLFIFATESTQVPGTIQSLVQVSKPERKAMAGWSSSHIPL